MQDIGTKNPAANLSNLNIKNYTTAFWNLSPDELIKHTVEKGMGVLADSGALCINTGEFTGRSPKNRFIVRDPVSEKRVEWGAVNKPFDPKKFDALWKKVGAYFKKKEVYVRDVKANAAHDPKYRLRARVVTEYPWSNQFANNMFLRPTAEEITDFEPHWTVMCAPGFKAVPAVDGTEAHNFAVINFKKKQLLIGGTGYTGEIKKGIFSAINFVLPVKTKSVLPMHCSANVGKSGDIALFFGLSGTGKTTLSADPNRPLIGDDEHAWAEGEVFNFEGGCYAKTIDLTEEKEPDIFRAIRHGAILENVVFKKGTNTVDFEDGSITENTRVSYPIDHISNAVQPSHALGDPKNIFFLTCDASGVLPPISKLTPRQAMYYFISGYTAKVAGTEVGVKSPQAAFSACFGAPFLPLHPTEYSDLLGKKLKQSKSNVWLVNTGWVAGGYGNSDRFKLKYTRALISAALEGKLDDVKFSKDKVFGLAIPKTCPNMPEGWKDKLLNPRKTWKNAEEYDAMASALAIAFTENFKKFEAKASKELMKAAPVPLLGVEPANFKIAAGTEG